MSNVKDKITTIAGWMVALSGLVLSLSTGGIVLPVYVITGASVCGTVGLAVIGFISGKNPNLTTKTAEQVIAANTNTTPLPVVNVAPVAPIIVEPVIVK